MVVRALTWNLFHGRDHPPDPRLFTWRSRLLRTTERGEGFAQVNRPLRAEFTDVLARIEWDVALLQEAPPRWLGPLGDALDATGACALTSRNSLGRLRALAADWNPDLIASHEGGSNQLLVRAPWRIDEVHRHTLTRRPERRRMLFARLCTDDGRELAVANLHGSVDSVPGAPDQILDAARQAAEWAAEVPLVFGGDLNIRPDRHAPAFAALEREHGLAPPTASDAIDHLLVRGLDLVEPPRRLPATARQVPGPDGLCLQLSDHSSVVCVAGMR